MVIIGVSYENQATWSIVVPDGVKVRNFNAACKLFDREYEGLVTDHMEFTDEVLLVRRGTVKQLTPG